MKPTAKQLARHGSFHENRNVKGCPICNDRKSEDVPVLKKRGVKVTTAMIRQIMEKEGI